MKSNIFLTNTIIAHRGVHYKCLENSIPSFLEAIKCNYTIELDVQLTKDNKVVVFHDRNLKRIFGIDRNISDLTYDEVKKFRYIPLFKEVLKLVDGKVPLIIDIKCGKGIEKKLACILDNYNGLFSIQSFNLYTILWFKNNRSNYLRGYLVYKFLYLRSILFILKPNYIGINLTNLEDLGKFRKKYIIIGYTLTTKKEYHRYKDYADNFICDIQR